MRNFGTSRNKHDEPYQAPLKWSLIWRTIGYTKPYGYERTRLAAVCLLRSIQTPTLGLVASLTLSGPVASRDWPMILTFGLGYIALAIFTQATMHFRMRWGQELGEMVVHDLRRDLFAQLQRLTMRYYDKTKLGRIISRMSSDAEAMRTGVQDVLFGVLVQSVSMAYAAAVMLWYDPVLFGIVLIMSPIVYAMTRYFRTRIGAASRKVQESFSRVTATLAESVNGIRVTQGFVRQDKNAERFEQVVSQHADVNMDQMKLSATFNPLIQLNNQFFIAALLLLGGYQVLITQGSLLPWIDHTPEQQYQNLWVFFFMVPSFFGAIDLIARQYNSALTAMAGAERVFELLDLEPEQLDAEDAKPLPPIQGRVVFDNLTFGYDPDHPVLHGISFATEPGQTIALVGHTGSGKSTIIKLISKFYIPTAGSLTIDGQDIYHVSTESLVNQLGIVLQQNFLFTGTILDNIRYGQPDATDEQAIQAARDLDCLDLLEQLPDGLNTQVGEKGVSLSLGQRQLVCFCRAMLANPRILILDEATSSVDTLTEHRIQLSLERLLQGRTSFVVAHRLSTIRHADQVLVLDHGHIVERGTHNQLLARNGVYSQLYRQFIRAGEA